LQCRDDSNPFLIDNEAGVVNRHVGLSLWLGQYETYEDHLHEDVIQAHKRNMQASNALEVPVRPESNTPTAAAVVFSIPYIISSSENNELPSSAETESRTLDVMVSAGKALDEREMFVRLTSARGVASVTSCYLFNDNTMVITSVYMFIFPILHICNFTYLCL
jgi:hypothetical protein